MKQITVIASKEFSENLRSVRFKILFVLFIVILLLAAYQGAQEFQKEMKQYNEAVKGISEERYSIRYYEIPKPSILSAFEKLINPGGITIIGAIIGIIIGFDSISGERERGTLKFVLTQPLYRDTLINGKILGYTILVFTVVLIATILSLGIIGGLTGIFPDSDETLRIIMFSLTIFIYIMFFTMLGMFFSIIFKQSIDALLASIAIFVILIILISNIAVIVADFVSPIPSYSMFSSSYGKSIQKAWENNWNVQQNVKYISPSENFIMINNVVLNPYFEKQQNNIYSVYGKQVKHSVSESLSMVWGNFVAILVGLVILFIASYVLFMKQDIGN
ncbi:MAG: ABC transporter permease [Candidatus Altarchaeaceae archaeon]